MATTSGGTPYVSSTDLVANYPTTSLSLANRTDVVASGGPVLVKTAGYTITVADILAGNKFLYNSASSGTFSLPTSNLVDGMVVEVAQIGAGALTVNGGTIVGTAVTSSQYQALRFVYVASGTTWYAVAESSPSGLSMVTPTSIANSGGSAALSGSEITFSAVNSISLNGIFTSTYRNYVLRINIVAGAGIELRIRYRSSGSDNTTSNYRSGTYRINSTSSSGNGPMVDGGTYMAIGDADTSGYSFFCMDVADPQTANQTRATVLGSSALSGTSLMSAYVGGSLFSGSTSFDGFTLYPHASTLTGSVRVYGLKN